MNQQLQENFLFSKVLMTTSLK